MYDVYARIMLLFGASQVLGALTYYCIGTAIAELRAFWIMWSMPMLFMAAQFLIMRLDIVRGSSGQHRLPHMEFAGHFAPYVAASALTLEYRWLYSHAGVVTAWVLVFVCFALHFLFACRMLDLAVPDWNQKVDLAEDTGKSWWPKHWKVPSAFAKAIWLIAPPKKLEPGQHDLVHEMQALARTGGGVSSLRRRKGGKAGKDELNSVGEKDTAPSALAQQTVRLDRLFQFWFDEAVWPQVPENGQRRLHELYSRYQLARKQALAAVGDSVSDNEWSDGGNDTVPQVARLEHEGSQYYLDKATGATS